MNVNTKTIKINSDQFTSSNRIMCEVELVNGLGYASLARSNILELNIDKSKKYGVVYPQLSWFNFAAINSPWPTGSTMDFRYTFSWINEECHNVYIENRLWTTDTRSRALFTNCTGIDGFVMSHDSVYFIGRYGAQMIINGKTFWSTPVFFNPDITETPDGYVPLLTDVMINVKNNDGSRHFLNGETIELESNLNWSITNPPLDSVVYQWTYRLRNSRESLPFPDGNSDTLTFKAEEKYDNALILLLVQYGLDETVAISNPLRLKVFTPLIEFPEISKVELLPNKTKYINGETIVIDSQIYWVNDMYISESTATYEWILTDKHGKESVISTEPILKMQATMAMNWEKIRVRVKYKGLVNKYEYKSSDNIIIPVYVPLVLNKNNPKLELIIIAVSISLIVILIIATIITNIGMNYKNTHDKTSNI